MGRERREYERYEVVAQVEISTSGEVSLLRLENISAGGALLTLDGDKSLPPVSAGDEIETFVDFGSDTAGGNLCISLAALVVRVVDRSGLRALALRWQPMSDIKADQLRRLMQYAHAQSAA